MTNTTNPTAVEQAQAEVDAARKGVQACQALRAGAAAQQAASNRVIRAERALAKAVAAEAVAAEAAEVEAEAVQRAVAAPVDLPTQYATEGTLSAERGGSSVGRFVRMTASSRIADEVSVTRNADGSVSLTILMGIEDQGDGSEWPTDGMGEVRISAASWAFLQGLA